MSTPKIEMPSWFREGMKPRAKMGGDAPGFVAFEFFDERGHYALTRYLSEGTWRTYVAALEQKEGAR